MTVQSFSFLFASFALLCWAAVAVVVVTAVVRRVRGPEAMAEFRDGLGRVALPLAWLVAAVTMAGSLYYSKVQGYVPCELCWYQRIVLYPFAVILAIAAWRRDSSIRVYAIPVLCIGVVISVYHSWIQWFPPPSGTSFCTTDTPCTLKYVDEFGFVTLPFMALSAAAVIIALLSISRYDDSEELVEEVEIQS
ncbi:MAG: disulfide bond formation protein B [Acidimicrobiia bacterium]|nr:disulfide bond formation protein B [Acidimicrobiia bacterium]